jgi:hypothetical protein
VVLRACRADPRRQSEGLLPVSERKNSAREPDGPRPDRAPGAVIWRSYARRRAPDGSTPARPEPTIDPQREPHGGAGRGRSTSAMTLTSSPRSRSLSSEEVVLGDRVTLSWRSGGTPAGRSWWRTSALCRLHGRTWLPDNPVANSGPHPSSFSRASARTHLARGAGRSGSSSRRPPRSTGWRPAGHPGPVRLGSIRRPTRDSLVGDPGDDTLVMGAAGGPTSHRVRFRTTPRGEGTSGYRRSAGSSRRRRRSGCLAYG